jgi:hypothetical protein
VPVTQSLPLAQRRYAAPSKLKKSPKLLPSVRRFTSRACAAAKHVRLAGRAFAQSKGALAEGNYDVKQLSSKAPLLVTVAINFPTRRITGEPPQLNTLIPGERAVSVQKISTFTGLDVQDVATQQIAPVVYGFSHCVSP